MNGDSPKEVAVTYETLYEVLRREKSRDELQKLDASFFTDVLNYLREKNQMLQDALQKNDLFSIAEREKLHAQLQNVRKILRELYERREKKIIEVALNKSKTRSALVDTSNMLQVEKYLFNALTAVLDSFRSGVLFNLQELKEPKIEITLGEENRQECPSADVPPAESVAAQNLEGERTEKQESGISCERKTIQIKFLQRVEQFVGEELELYGPFEPGTTVYLPTGIAKVLINRGSAVEVLDEEEDD